MTNRWRILFLIHLAVPYSNSFGSTWGTVRGTKVGRHAIIPIKFSSAPTDCCITALFGSNNLHNDRRMSKRDDEFQWLNWIYSQWRHCRPGEISEPVMKQMIPAITQWGRRKSLNSAERAEQLLNRIIEEHLAGNKHAVLDVTIFNAAMDAHAKISNPHGVQRILRTMDKLRKEQPTLSHLRPDVITMSTLATAWAKSRLPEAAIKAEAILKYMAAQGLQPNTIVYNAVLHAMAISFRLDKAARSETIIEQMKQQYAAGEDCKPDVYTYQALILAWSRTPVKGSLQKAENVLQYLFEESKAGNRYLAPNVHCFSCKYNGMMGILLFFCAISLSNQFNAFVR